MANPQHPSPTHPAAGPSPLSGKHIVLGITGSIAAYKSCLIIRALVKRGAEVQVVITPAGKEFITPITLSALSRHPVISDFFSQRDGTWHSHVDLGLWADAMLIAPCTASSLGKMAHGVADNMLVTTYLSMKAPVFIAPAMDLDMYQHPSTQANISTLKGYGNRFVEPTSGFLASGLEGKGRMQEPDLIVEEMERFFADSLKESAQDQEEITQEAAQKEKMLPLAGKRILITAGPTYERIDPVRFIGNRSSGKMGIALAGEAARRGAAVTLVLGPTSLDVPRGVECVRVQTAAEMLQAALSAFQTADAAICAAAVADYTPASPADHKLKKAHERLDHIELVETVDILAELSRQKGERCVIGFAAETDNVVEYARRKLSRKGCDVIIANDVSRADSGFGTDTNKAWIVSTAGTQELPVLTKPQLADTILDLLQNL